MMTRMERLKVTWMGRLKVTWNQRLKVTWNQRLFARTLSLLLIHRRATVAAIVRYHSLYLFHKYDHYMEHLTPKDTEMKKWVQTNSKQLF